MLSVEARIYLNTEDEGGLTQPGFSGMQPSMDIKGELVACKLIDCPEGERIELGQEHDVRIDLPYGEEYAEVVRSSFKFNLNVGGRIVGRGKIL